MDTTSHNLDHHVQMTQGLQIQQATRRNSDETPDETLQNQTLNLIWVIVTNSGSQETWF